MTTIHIPEEYRIYLASHPGFILTVPNGTNIHVINDILGEFLQWSADTIIKQSSKQPIQDLPERLPL